MDIFRHVVRFGRSDNPIKILFLHGGPGMDHSYFLPHFKALSRQAELLFYTQGVTGARTIAELILEIDAILAELKPVKPFLFGHSFGGSLALEYVGRRGEKKLSGLILCSWLYSQKIWLKDFSVRARRNPAAYRMDDFDNDAGFRKSMVKMAPLYFCNSHVEKGRRILRGGKYDFDLYRMLSENFYHDFDRSLTLKKVKLPTLSLTGTQDRIVGVETIRRAARLNKGIQSHEIARAGHFPFVEKTARVNDIAARFVLNVPLL